MICFDTGLAQPLSHSGNLAGRAGPRQPPLGTGLPELRLFTLKNPVKSLTETEKRRDMRVREAVLPDSAISLSLTAVNLRTIRDNLAYSTCFGTALS